MQSVLVELGNLIRDGEAGDKLPTIRELAKKHHCNQADVQAAFSELKRQDLIESHVGRGTFIKEPQSNNSDLQTKTVGRILLMQKQDVMARGVQAMAGIAERAEQNGLDCMQVIYRNLIELSDNVRQMPKFDGFVLSTRFSIVPAQLLGYLRSRSKAVVLDGHAVGGLDIDCVGTNWSTAVDMAVAKLLNLGHRNISLLAPNTDLRPMLMAKDHFESLGHWGIVKRSKTSVRLFDYSDASVDQISDCLEKCDATASGSTTAVIVLGLFDGRTLLSALKQNDLTPGKDISIIVLGTNDVFFEHLDVFDTIGGYARDTSDIVFELIKERLDGVDTGRRLHFLEVSEVDRGSCCKPTLD